MANCSKMGKKEMRERGGQKEYAQVQELPEYLCMSGLIYAFRSFFL